ncbi:MAG: hypothetical protein LBH74_00325 [Nitrososphaerota archaeon]|jgi:hypothetical protein|nr:hypothetical protein [Nitrososphaerota archaeon]
MKHSKSIIVLVLVGVISSLLLVSGYVFVYVPASKDGPLERSLEKSQIQIFSPQDNVTYQGYNVPLNITANNATAKIIYSLNGDENSTYTEELAEEFYWTLGVNNLTVYAFDSEGNIGDCKTIAFTIDLSPKITQQELQSIISYFTSQELSIIAHDDPPKDWRDLGSFLNAGSVQLKTKEELVDFAKTHGITTLHEFISSKHVSFCANLHNNSALPIVYHISFTLS